MTTASPRVSVIVPAHNAAAFLEETLSSILGQTYTAWECVVTDDASKDATEAIASAFAGSEPDRFRVVRLDRSAGPAGARNAAIAASGPTELIALLDADDRWLPTYLERQVSLYDAARKSGMRPGIVACNAFYEGSDGVRVGTFAELHGWRDRVTYDDMIEASYVFVSALFPRAAFEEVGDFSTDCFGSEDYDLWLRIIEAGYDVVTNREPLVIYRRHGTSISTSKLRTAEAVLVAYRRALARDAPTSSQRRAIRAQIRHYRAIRERALVQRAAAEGRLLAAGGLALRAAPHGLVAFAQAPSRWVEWLCDLSRIAKKPEKTRTPS